MRITARIILGIAMLVGATQARAALSPIAIGIFPPVQFPSEDVSITGLRLNLLWGEHRAVYGLDLGVGANVTTQEFIGLADIAGGMNYNGGAATVIGAQIAGITNINVNKAKIVGIQASLALNRNMAESELIGLQIAALGNFSEHATIWGAQLGIYNSANVVYGFQIGLVNVTDELHGIQIGLLNFNKKGLFSVCPILNIGF